MNLSTRKAEEVIGLAEFQRFLKVIGPVAHKTENELSEETRQEIQRACNDLRKEIGVILSDAQKNLESVHPSKKTLKKKSFWVAFCVRLKRLVPNPYLRMIIDPMEKEYEEFLSDQSFKV